MTDFSFPLSSSFAVGPSGHYLMPWHDFPALTDRAICCRPAGLGVALALPVWCCGMNHKSAGRASGTPSYCRNTAPGVGSRLGDLIPRGQNSYCHTRADSLFSDTLRREPQLSRTAPINGVIMRRFTSIVLPVMLAVLALVVVITPRPAAPCIYQLATETATRSRPNIQGLKGQRVAVVCVMNPSNYGDGATSTVIAERVERIYARQRGRYRDGAAGRSR